MPHLPLFISRRYLLAKKSHNAINLITGISVAVLALGTMAMVLILSVFNGLEDLIASLYNTVRPDIEIKPTKGKFFSHSDLNYNPNSDPSVICWSDIIEDMALLKYSPNDGNDRQTVVKIKAVSPTYNCISNIDSMVFDGIFIVEYGSSYFAVMGYGVAGRLDLRLQNPENPLYFYYPRANAQQSDLLNAFNIETAIPAGVISLQQEDDDRLVYLSLNMARKLMNLDSNLISSVELQLAKDIDLNSFSTRLQKQLGSDFIVKNRRQLNDTLYKITQSEKWSGFLILAFILLLAAFNIIGSITVLIIDKKEDLKTFIQLGLTTKMIKKIFLYEGLMISFFGGLVGMLMALILIFLQQKFGFVPMKGSFAVTDFPVAMRFSDFALVGGLVLFLGFFSTWISVRRIGNISLTKNSK